MSYSSDLIALERLKKGTKYLILSPLLFGITMEILSAIKVTTIYLLSTTSLLVGVAIVLIFMVKGMLYLRSGFSLLSRVRSGKTGATLWLVALFLFFVCIALNFVLTFSPNIFEGYGLNVANLITLSLPLGIILAIIANILIGVGFYKVGKFYNSRTLKAGGILITTFIFTFIGFILTYLGLRKIVRRISAGMIVTQRRSSSLSLRLSPSNYPLFLFPLFTLSSYYFYKLGIVIASILYFILYLAFVILYFYSKKWVLPLIYNLFAALLPLYFTNELSLATNTTPTEYIIAYLFLALAGLGTGNALTNPNSSIKAFGAFATFMWVFLSALGLIFSCNQYLSFSIWFMSTLYFMTVIITKRLHPRYVLLYTTPQIIKPPVHFWIVGLPQGISLKITVNGKKYKITNYYKGAYYLTVKGNKDQYVWSVPERILIGNYIYTTYVSNGIAYAGDDVIIRYNLITPTPVQTTPQPAPSSVANIQLGSTVSRKLYTVKQSQWDPRTWIGKTLYNIYKISDVIGEGGYAYVLKGESDGKPVALKVLKLDNFNPSENFKELFEESSNLVSLSEKSPKIIKIYGIYIDKQVMEGILKGNIKLYETNPPMIAMEFMEGGTLKEILMDDMMYYSSKWEKTVYRAIRDVAEALNVIHSNGYVHMDVKPQNIFLTEKPQQPYDLDKVGFKLGDLGSAVKEGGKITQITVEYSPPEVYEQAVANSSIDIFALGMTMYVLLTRKNDRPDLNDMEEAFDCYQRSDMQCVYRKVIASKSKLASWDPNVPDEVKPLVKAMLSPDPSRRPKAIDVVNYLNRLIK